MTNSVNSNMVLQQGAAVGASIPSGPIPPKVLLDVNSNPAIDLNEFADLPITQQLLQANLISKAQALEIKNQVQITAKPETEIILSGLFIDKDKLLKVKSIIFKDL